MSCKGIEQAVWSHSTQLCCVSDLGQAARSSNVRKHPRLADDESLMYMARGVGKLLGEEKVRGIDWEIVNCRHQNNLALIGR